MIITLVSIGLILCILLSAFFSASEMAFSSCNTVRLENMTEEKAKGWRKARTALRITENFDNALSAILIGNNLVNIASSSLASVLVILIMDSDRYTNLRKSPGGSVLGRLDNSENEYVITICEPANGWWRIFDDFVGSMELSGEAWIHYSVLGMRTRNYGGQALPLRASASEQAAVVATIREEEETVRPMDISADGKWTKVKCDAGTGWIESRWLCGNPYTTCP